jgi:excisionase family DNA binding protein
VKEFFRVAEVQQILNLGRTKVYEIIRAGKLRKVAFDGCIRVSREAIDDYIRQR